MEIVASILKYRFVVCVGIEIALMLRSLAGLAREKARAPGVPAAPAEE
jgi:hypothetical protein